MRASRPYQLAFMEDPGQPGWGWLCVKGDPAVVTQLLDVPGAVLCGSLLSPTGYVRIPAARETVLAVEALATPQQVSASYLRERPRLVGIDPTPARQAIERTLKLQKQPLHHQLEFCSMAMPKRACYNASEQGTGKTVVGWLMACLWGSRRTLILSEKNLIPQWVDEHADLFDNRYPRPIHPEPLTKGSIPDRLNVLRVLPTAQPVAVLMNYEAIAREEVRNTLIWWRPNTIICDEAWHLKSMRAAATRHTKEVAGLCDHVLLMAGTPIGNDVGDLWSQLCILDPTWDSLPYHDFMQRFCRYRREYHGAGLVRLIPTGCLDPANLARRLEPYWYRALRATVGDMPRQIFHRPVRLDLPPATRATYQQVREFGESVLGHETSLADERVVMIRLHQICGGWLPQYRETEKSGEFDWQFSRIFPWPKVDWVKDWCRAHLLQDRTVRAIIWCRYNMEIDTLMSELRPILGDDQLADVWGETPDRALEEIKLSFNSRDPNGVQVIVAQLAKMCAGHNLPAGDHHVFYSNSFSYLQRSQAEGRSTRVGRTTPVQYWDVVMRGTIDEAIIGALRRKQDLTTRLAVETVGESRVVTSDQV